MISDTSQQPFQRKALSFLQLAEIWLKNRWLDQKEIMGCWISENEGVSFYAGICSDLKKRGVTDIIVACHDNIKGLSEAINAVFPKTKQQLCIVHQIRNSTKFVPYKDRKAVCAD